jgi:hypothetical protein
MIDKVGIIDGIDSSIDPLVAGLDMMDRLMTDLLVIF